VREPGLAQLLEIRADARRVDLELVLVALGRQPRELALEQAAAPRRQ